MGYELRHASLPVNGLLVEMLVGEWRRFGQPGTWWTGAERVAIAAEARAARARARKAGSAGAGENHDSSGPLSAAELDAVHRIASDPGGLSERWAREAFEAGLTAEKLVEMTSLVAILTIGDTLARACGSPQCELPEPVAGEPTPERPAGLETDSAWVPVVHPDRAEGAVKAMYDSFRRTAGYVYNIGRALTLVPAAAASFGRAFFPVYNTHEVPGDGELSRPQIELLASTVSGANECFY